MASPLKERIREKSLLLRRDRRDTSPPFRDIGIIVLKEQQERLNGSDGWDKEREEQERLEQERVSGLYQRARRI